MDSESLDQCIQTALSALYPPFQATSPTVLCQVLDVVQSCYRGDGLRYLIHFLLPAKQFLTNLQQNACLQYCGVLFRHEGWPLCVHEKVVVQLCPLDQHLLRSGDFYLLVSPPAVAPLHRADDSSGRSAVTSPRLLLCSVSAGSHHVEQQEVSEVALRSLFSMAWLDSVNREREQRGASRLERCLLSAQGDVFKVPWEDLVYPQFMSRPCSSLKEDKESPIKDGDVLINTSHNLCRDTNTSRQDVKLFPSIKTDQSPASSEGEDSEGEYVELTELPLPRFSPQKGSLTQSISLQHRAKTSNTHCSLSAHTPPNAHTHTGTAHSSRACVEVSDHSRLCSRLIEENLNQDSDGPVILTPISPTSSSSCSSSSCPPPEVFGSSSCQLVRWTSQEQTEGSDSGQSLKLNTEPANCTEHRQEEEVQEEVQEEGQEGERGSEGDTEEKREERELMEWKEGKQEMVVLADEKEKQLEEECRRDEDLLLHEDEEGGETEEEDDESEGTGGDDELQEEGAEEVEVDEEIQVIVVQQSQERREEEQVMEEEGEEGEKGGEQTHIDEEEADSCNTHCEGFSSENHTQHTHTQESNTAAMDPDSHWAEHEESASAQEKKEQEEEEEECNCEEVGGGRTAELHTEVLSSERPPAQSHVRLSAGPSPPEPEPAAASPQLDQSAAPTVPARLARPFQSLQSSFYRVLLSSGALCLPGTRDRSGRALLTVCTCSTVWSNPDCDSAELLRLLLYYTCTLRKEVGASGLTVLVDARGAAPAPALFSALRSLQDNLPGSIHTVLLLVNKDSSQRLDKPAAIQVEVLTSLKSVQKHVDVQQLPAEFGGSFSFSQSSWLCFRSRVEQLTNQCEDVINLLQKTINILQATALPAAAQDAKLLLSRYQAVMRSILEDSRLVQLQQEGGASLSRLRREEGSISVTEDYRAAVETVSALYDEVDELLHRLVTLSNSRTEELHFLLEFRSLEQGFTEVRSWLEEVGKVRLKSLNEPDDSLQLLDKKQQDFRDFQTTAYKRCMQGEALLSRLERWGDMPSADLHAYKVKVHSFWALLQDFSQRVNTTGHNIERAVQLYRFLDQAYGWALQGMRLLAGTSMEECSQSDKCQAVIGRLEDYRRQHPPIPDSRFQEMKAVAGDLRGERGLRQWSFAWSKCEETRKMFDRKLEMALRTRDSTQRQHPDSALSRHSTSFRKTLSGFWGVTETSSRSCSWLPEEDTSSPSRNTSTPVPTSSSPITPRHTPLLQRLFRTTSSEESSDRIDLCSSSPSLPLLGSSASFTPSPACSSSHFSSSRRQQLRKTQSFDCPSTPEVSRCGSTPRTFSEPLRRGNTGVFIRGLEVSSSGAADHTLCPGTAAHGWTGRGPRGPGTPGTPRTSGSPATDSRPRGSRLRHVVEEMVTTEREYVRSLRYIIHHYFPEMDRADLPQDLRGKRSVVFGNLEKLLDFHSQFFLRELEACWKHPLRVPHCFLRHQEQFSLYALYSKNKPKSDALLANGNSFFRRKQVELADKMDLSSYLLKPIQRMSKYALLLTDLMKEVGVAQEAELVALQAATSMVKFQLRHGNDLLAMDAIRDCDVNLKEQGQLLRQDEFTVWTGRRKCQRHIFLFEELVLFSKPKKMDGGLDVFIYKHSFKTADVGLTESAGDNGLRFEIWFRRRTSRSQTFILQSATADIKRAWTTDIARILWTQATRNKEMRLKEMVSMGVGNKPFLDIQPSDAAISDRAVHCIMKSRGARTRASIAVSVFDHSNPFQRGALTSDLAVPGPSSSSLLGPLNLHMCSQALPPSPAAESSFITCIEEDEQEHETSSQPSMTTESSGSSSRCLSGSTGSDSGCVSSHLQEVLLEEPSPRSQPCSSSNKQHLNSQCISPKAAAVIGPTTIV